MSLDLINNLESTYPKLFDPYMRITIVNSDELIYKYNTKGFVYIYISDLNKDYWKLTIDSTIMYFHKSQLYLENIDSFSNIANAIKKKIDNENIDSFSTIANSIKKKIDNENIFILENQLHNLNIYEQI